MPRQLEQPHYADYAEELEDVRVLEVRGELLQQQVDVEAHRGDHVDQVHRALDEVAAVRARQDADHELEAEPGVAHALDVEERVVGVRVRLVQDPGGAVARVHRLVHDHRHPHVRVGLQAERQDGHADEEDRDHADNLQEPNTRNPNSLVKSRRHRPRATRAQGPHTHTLYLYWLRA